MQAKNYEAPSLVELGSIEAMTAAATSGRKVDQTIPSGSAVPIPGVTPVFGS